MDSRAAKCPKATERGAEDGGCEAYAFPPLPMELDVKEKINTIIASEESVIDKAISVCLYCMKTQVFIDGNKRASIIFANHYMIRNGEGLLVVPESEVEEFKSLLVAYYEGRSEDEITEFMKGKCWRKF